MIRGNIDWISIRARYEKGETSHAISKSLNGRPTRQGIEKRAKRERWYKPGRAVASGNEDGNALVNTSFHIQCPDQLQAELASKHNFTLRKAEHALKCLRRGATHTMAAAICGVTLKTWEEWRKASPSLQSLCEQAKSLHAMENIEHINRAAPNDWRAAERLLECNDMASQTWGKKGGPHGLGIGIQINTGVPKGPHVTLIEDEG